MNWVIRRFLFFILTLFVVITSTFFITSAMPGNIIDTYVSERIREGFSVEEAYRMAQALYAINMSEPLLVRYIKYLKNLLTGNLGTSYMYSGTPVFTILIYAVPWTVFISSISVVISFTLGIIQGLWAAYSRKSKISTLMTGTASFLMAVPNYVIATAFLLVFAYHLGIFPRGGAYDAWIRPGMNLEFVASALYHAVLPVMSYIVATYPGWLLLMRSNTIRVLGEDYVIAAEARGLPKSRITYTYVARNAIIPMITNLAISLGSIFGGATFIETIFTYPGIGMFLSQSVGAKDIPMMQGCFLLITVATITANFIVDLLYGKIDPRIRAIR